MARPITLVFQELAQQTPQVVEPDLNCLVLAPAYQIRDYEDDKETIQVADYGTLNADNPYTPPAAFTPAIVLAAAPDLAAGAWVDPDSIRVYFDDVRVIMASGTNGAVTLNDNLITSAGATFVTNGVQIGDTVIIDDPALAGPFTPNLVYTVVEVVSNTQIRVTSNFNPVVTATGLKYRIERRLDDQRIDNVFVSEPVFRSSNEITVLGGVTLNVNTVPRTVSYAKVYVGYRAYRTDLQEVDSISGTTEIETKIGKIDARNPLAALCFVAKQNAGNAPIYFYGVETDDLVGYSKARDDISSNKSVYAEVIGNPDVAISAMFKADNVSLADPATALSTGVPQKFRVGIGSEELVTTADIVTETATATTEQKVGAIPPGVKTIGLVGATLLTAGVKPGDQLILTYSENVSPLNGTYNISHLNSETELEVDTAFPATVGAAEGANWRIYRPSLGTDVVSEQESRAFLNNLGVRYYANIGGVTAGARTVQIVDAATTPGGIHSIVEVSGVSTVITLDATAAVVTAQQVVDALTSGAGVTIPFAGSVNLVAVAVTPATVQNAALASTALSTGTAGVDRVTSTAALDAVYIRLFDSAATFITDGVTAGDIIEIPSNPNGVYGPSGTKRFVVNQVLSEQRLEIQNIVSGAYVNNTSTVENELPHIDNRLGLGPVLGAVTQGTIRYRIVRDLSKDQQVTALVSVAQSLRSQRAILAWPDLVEVADLVDGSKTRNLDGTAADADPQPGTFMAAVVGGMTAGLPNHQGFSRLGCAGIRRLYHSSGYFTERQLSTLSDGGWYVFVQDTPESLPYSIHQLTTDPSALQTGEYSMVKNFDFLSKFYVSILDPFIGVWNVNEETIGFIRQALNSGTAQLKLRRYARIGAPLIDASITSLEISDASPDRIEVFMALDRPTPLNTIGLHLVG